MCNSLPEAIGYLRCTSSAIAIDAQPCPPAGWRHGRRNEIRLFSSARQRVVAPVMRPRLLDRRGARACEADHATRTIHRTFGGFEDSAMLRLRRRLVDYRPGT